MESEKRFASSSASTSAWAERLGGEADRLVKTEIEAAETLADLARLAMRETASDSGEKQCKKGKQGKRRLSCESPTDDSGLNGLDSASKCPDLSRDQAVEGHQPHQISASETKKIQQDVCLREVKTEQDADLAKTSTVCTSYSLVGCSKSRRNLTEEEKEARRIRRVLANRESARQTIRRRQALCEELTRKAANLALENESLKKEKELALKEYQSLENTNKHLKAQIAKSVNTMADKTPDEHDLPASEITSSSTSSGPWFLCSHFPVTQLFWPSVIQSSNPVQSQHTPHGSAPIPSNISLPFSSESDLCHKENNLIQDNEIQNPLYLFPYPWFFPPPESGHGQAPLSVGLKNKQDGYPVGKPCSINSTPNTVTNNDNQATLPFKIKTEASGWTEVRPIDDPNHATPNFSLDGDEQQRGCHIMERYHPAVVKEEHGFKIHPAPDTELRQGRGERSLQS
ncbi:light-inducible protein CPRF2 isoform X2 [Neltuma alba]|uniref:light-inducible protein CPRF2 isoform X2 n=1 Tax=Neltuma alba TaxID=207710 RepID=UPI0010A591EA|nr:light-inducible protein CPRF2 isoform X2 [Prosopis alba]